MSLDRFLIAHQNEYSQALLEIKNGRKTSHWIWFIFPQLKGLGKSYTSQYYGLDSLQETRKYLANPILKEHLLEISQALFELNTNISQIVGYPDDLKIKSCMTLFEYTNPKYPIFSKVLDKFYDGERDTITLDILKKEKSI